MMSLKEGSWCVCSCTCLPHDVFGVMKVGGRQEGLQAAEPLLRAMGSRVVYCGGTGNGAVSFVFSLLSSSLY